jgi:hypothetical protein
MAFPGPLSAEEEARVAAYFSAGPVVAPTGPLPNVADTFGPAPAPRGPEPAPAPFDLGASAFGTPGTHSPAPPPPQGGHLGQLAAYMGGMAPAPAGLLPAQDGFGKPTPQPPTSPTGAALSGIPGPAPIASKKGPTVARTDGLTGNETTPAEDREYAALLQHLENQKKPKKAAGGGGAGSAPSNPDPYGVKGARAAVLGSYDAQKAGLEHQVGAEGERAGAVAGMRGDLARQQMEDAEIHAREQEEAQRGFEIHMTEMQQQLDTVRAKQIDPDRLMKQDGMAARAIIGGIFGGLYMGLNKLDKNPFIEDLQRQIDRDNAVQEKNLDHDQKNVANSMNLLREQRATFKDNDLAKLANKRAIYEAYGNAIEAEAGKYDQPIAKARAEQALAALDREKGSLDLAIKEKAQHAAQMAAAAGAAQKRAALLEERKMFSDTYEKVIASGASPAQAEAEADRMVKILYGGGAGERPQGAAAGADILAGIPKGQQSEAIKELAVKEKKERTNAMIDQLEKAALARSRVNPLNAIPGTEASDRGNQIDVMNSRIIGLIRGPGDSDAKSEERLKKMQIDYGDNDATIKFKLAQLRDQVAGNNSTPILDAHAPKAPPKVAQTNIDGTPKR